VLLLLAAAAVEISTLVTSTITPQFSITPMPPANTVYLAISVVLAVAAVGMAVAAKVKWHVLLLLAALLYPYAVQLGFVATGGNTNLIGNPTPLHLVSLYVPLLVFAWGAIVIPMLRASAVDEDAVAWTQGSPPR
jgi:hypothetical protein